jgi:hypothetical protein
MRWSIDAFRMGRAGILGHPVDPVTARYRDAVSRYAPAPYGGRVAVLRSGVMARWTASLGWSRLAARVEAARIPGAHFTAITRHVDALGTIVRGCLDRALARGAAPAVAGRKGPAGNRW